jgi:hypothetical protein
MRPPGLSFAACLVMSAIGGASCAADCLVRVDARLVAAEPDAGVHVERHFSVSACVTNTSGSSITIASSDDCAFSSWKFDPSGYRILIQSCRKSSYHLVNLEPMQSHCVTLQVLGSPTRGRSSKLRVGFVDARSGVGNPMSYSWSEPLRLHE